MVEFSLVLATLCAMAVVALTVLFGVVQDWQLTRAVDKFGQELVTDGIYDPEAYLAATSAEGINIDPNRDDLVVTVYDPDGAVATYGWDQSGFTVTRGQMVAIQATFGDLPMSPRVGWSGIAEQSTPDESLDP